MRDENIIFQFVLEDIANTIDPNVVKLMHERMDSFCCIDILLLVAIHFSSDTLPYPTRRRWRRSAANSGAAAAT